MSQKTEYETYYCSKLNSNVQIVRQYHENREKTEKINTFKDCENKLECGISQTKGSTYFNWIEFFHPDLKA